MSIRFARKADCAAIAEIYNHAVLYTAAIWNDQTVDADNRIAWFEARTIAGYPVLVSEEDGVVTGYASFGDWRSFDGFRHTVEHSVYVHPDHQGKGLGRKLLSRWDRFLSSPVSADIRMWERRQLLQYWSPAS